ncbi:MAG: 3',5'-cyclic-nucleotide phosphodiesterase [Burkholderiaceae bacterium]|nr:3',5'-cyclic-nucleotide phosphodiesterase [Burkholderiaceae bacterium]
MPNAPNLDYHTIDNIAATWSSTFQEAEHGIIIDQLRDVHGFHAMNLQVLGCAGGIGGRERLTTCLLLDDDILLDAGTGLASLDMEQLVKIEHVFLSHSHLDHIAGLALLADAILGKKVGPVTIHATDKVMATLKSHFFNWLIWPDFATIPSAGNSVLRWETVQHGVAIDLGGRSIVANPVNHSVDATSYLVRERGAAFLFTGDMSTTPALWEKMKSETTLAKVIVDCSFTDADSELAAVSGHYCPRTLQDDIQFMPKSTEFLIYHLKPGQEEIIMQELKSNAKGRSFEALRCGDRFVF